MGSGVRHILFLKATHHQSLSSLNYIKTEVPQVPVLGPVNFSPYINDLPTSLKDTHVIMYADDTCLLLPGNWLSTLDGMVNEELKVVLWFASNKVV